MLHHQEGKGDTNACPGINLDHVPLPGNDQPMTARSQRKRVKVQSSTTPDKEWAWSSGANLDFSVRLDRNAQVLTWWRHSKVAIGPLKPCTTQRVQSIADFCLRGPSPDNITLWEREHPEWINHVYDPFYNEGEPDEPDGPRLHDIPTSILKELADELGCDPQSWPKPAPTDPQEEPTKPRTHTRTEPELEGAEHASTPRLPRATTQEMEQFSALLKRFPRLCSALKTSAYSLLHKDGREVQGRFMELFAPVLAPVVRGETDLRELIAVISDARQAARQCGTLGMPVSDDIIRAYVHATADLSSLLRQMFAKAPVLATMFLAHRSLGVRLLCLDDAGLKMDITEYADVLSGLVASREDATAFVTLMARCASNGNVHGASMMRALPKLKEALATRTGVELFEFVLRLVKRGTYLFSMDEPEWIAKMADRKRTLAGKVRKPLRETARLERYEQVVRFAEPWLTSSRNIELIEEAFQRMYGYCFGYSDAHADMQAMIPAVMEIGAPLAGTVTEFIQLCAAVPRLVERLPGDGESTEVGWRHWYDVSELKQHAGRCKTMAEFLAGAEQEGAR